MSEEEKNAFDPLDAEVESLKNEVFDRAEEDGVEFAEVKYVGEDGLVNYDVAPYNIVKDEKSGSVGQSAVLKEGETYLVPKDLLENLAVTAGFEIPDEGIASAAPEGQDAPSQDAAPADEYDEPAVQEASGGEGDS